VWPVSFSLSCASPGAAIFAETAQIGYALEVRCRSGFFTTLEIAWPLPWRSMSAGAGFWPATVKPADFRCIAVHHAVTRTLFANAAWLC
jgi:hypothetical protein